MTTIKNYYNVLQEKKILKIKRNIKSEYQQKREAIYCKLCGRNDHYQKDCHLYYLKFIDQDCYSKFYCLDCHEWYYYGHGNAKCDTCRFSSHRFNYCEICGDLD